MNSQPPCPKCKSEYTYKDGNLWVCPECAHEWSAHSTTEDLVPVEQSPDDTLIRDASGNVLNNGDSVTVIKELKIKGSSAAVKVGTKVKNIRLTDGDDGHNISCKIEGLGSLNLKSEFVRKI